MGQNSGHNVTESFASWSLTRLQSRGQPRLEPHLKAQLVRINFQAHVVAGRIQFLAGCFPENLSSLLAVSCSFPRGLLHRQFTTWQLASSEPARRSPRKLEVTILCKVITEVTSYHLCCFLLVRTSYVSCSHSRGGDYTRVWMPRDKDHFGYLRVCWKRTD